MWRKVTSRVRGQAQAAGGKGCRALRAAQGSRLVAQGQRRVIPFHVALA